MIAFLHVPSFFTWPKVFGILKFILAIAVTGTEPGSATQSRDHNSPTGSTGRRGGFAGRIWPPL